MALMLTTLIIMFGMVVSIGHLVYSKINLQNATDLAAMSSASWQARHLNAISLVNYRLRQNYKWTVFDVYVTQSRFNYLFRTEVIGQSGYLPANLAAGVFGVCMQNYGYFAQANNRLREDHAGEGVGPSDDFCQNTAGSPNNSFIPELVVNITPTINPFIIAQQMLLLDIREKIKDICRTSGAQNLQYLEYFLDRRFPAIQNFQLDQARNAIAHFSRNFPAGPAVSGGVGADSARATFFANLGGANRGGGFTLEWLTPSRSRATRNFDDYFTESRVFFRLPWVLFREAGGCFIETHQKDSAQAVMGFSRDMAAPGTRIPRNPINSILKGTANPNILFWPRGTGPTLVAVGAAKPFGSRIGPPQHFYEREGNQGPGGIANLNFFPGDMDQGGVLPGIGSRDVLNELLRSMPRPASGNPAFRPPGDGAFAQLSNAPTLYEAVFFNPFPVSVGAFFPSETMTSTSETNNDYELDDRGGTTSHQTVIGGIPGFYANNPNLIRSSWGPNDSDRRMGYQIKLGSLNQLCRELGGAGATGELGSICGGSVRVFH